MRKQYLSVIITSYNAQKALGHCLDSVVKNTKELDCEIIVVDNASCDKSAEMVRKSYPQARLILNKTNLGFAAGNNIGIKKSTGEYILILNSDVVVLNSLKCLVDFMCDNRSVGIAGCAIYNAGMKLRPCIKKFPQFFSELYKLTVLSVKDLSALFPARCNGIKMSGGIADVDWVDGCFILTRKDVLEKIGCMDERYFLYYEDVDLCYSVKKELGMRVVYNPCLKVKHLGGGSTAFSNALYLTQYYVSCVAYFAKRRGSLFCYIFSLTCVMSWIILHVILSVANLALKKESFERKIHMLRYVLRNTLIKKTIHDR